MDSSVKVAVVRGENRREAVSRALGLIEGELRRVIRPGGEVLIKPNLVSHTSQRPSTHRDTFGAALKCVFGAGAGRVVVAEGATDATAGFRRFGFHREAAGRDVRFFDINRDETDWEDLTLSGVQGEERIARVSRTIAHASCRVSLALAKTHVTSIVTFCLKNMLSSIHPKDRVMMHGYAGGGNGYSGWRRLVVEFLKQDNFAVNVLTRAMGRAKNVRTAWRSARRTGDAFHTLNPAELNYLRSVEAMNHKLVSLAEATKPHVAVVDGFLAMHREGPRHGTPINLKTVIAGTDAVAVDAVAAAMMGFEPRQIGYLVYAEAAGLGVIDLARIALVGDPLDLGTRRCVPHSNHDIQRHWYRLAEATRRGPHFSLAQDRAERDELR